MRAAGGGERNRQARRRHRRAGVGARGAAGVRGMTLGARPGRAG